MRYSSIKEVTKTGEEIGIGKLASAANFDNSYAIDNVF